MKQLIIQIKTHARSHAVDYQFPGEIPIQDLIPLLIRNTGWPQKDDEGNPLFYWFENQNRVLDEELTFLAAGIRHGATLFIKSGTEKPVMIKEEKIEKLIEPPKQADTKKEKLNESPEPKELIVEFEPLFPPQNISIQDRRSPIAPPSDWKKIEDEDIYN